MGDTRAHILAQLRAVCPEVKQPVEGHTEESQRGTRCHLGAGHLHAQVCRVPGPLGEGERLRLLAGYAHLPARCPSGDDIGRLMGPPFRLLDGGAAAERRRIVGVYEDLGARDGLRVSYQVD